MDRRPKVVVVGSSNTDMVIRAPRLPVPGETVLGGDFAMAPGGKGANQAVAAARLGADVLFIARVGDDLFGAQAITGFAAEGIDTTFVASDPDSPTGVALIGVDTERGENQIIAAPGANSRLSVADVKRAAHVIRAADVLICQLEVPLETTVFALRLARGAGVTTILNPAPAAQLTDEVLALADILTPNETEAAFLSGAAVSEPITAARLLRGRGARAVVVTLGAAGAHLVSADADMSVAGLPAERVVDTTAAGDCFSGALAVALAERLSLPDAIDFANAAAALSVTRAGAQPPLPTRVAGDAIRGRATDG